MLTVRAGRVGGAVVGLGGAAAHHAGQADGTGLVGDDDVLRVEGAVDPVEGLEHLAGLGVADGDGAVQQRPVVGVDRVAGLQHRVVGGVHDVADGAHAGQVQPLLDLRRRGAHGDALDAAAVPAPYPGAVGKGHLDGGVAARVVAELGEGQVRTRQRVQVAGQAPDGGAVAPVGGQVDVEDGFLEVEPVGDVGADGRVVAQQPDAGVVLAHAQLTGGGEHAVGRDAHQLLGADLEAAGQRGPRQRRRNAVADGEVLGAADDLPLALAVEGVDQRQLVGLGDGGEGQDLHDLQAAGTGGGPLDGVHLESTDGQDVGKLLGGQVEVDVGVQPGNRNAHDAFSA